MTQDELLKSLSLMLILTSFSAIEIRNLRGAVYAYMTQALVMVLIITAFAFKHHALFVWALTALVTKFGLVSWFLWRAVKPGDEQEFRPLVDFLPSAVLIGILAMVTYNLTHTYASFLAPTPTATEEPFRTNIAVALTVFLIGLYGLLTRRDAFKVVIGLCLMENGAHLSLVSLALGMRETVVIGIATDVVIAVYLLLYLISGIREQFQSRDTFLLSELRW